MPPALAITNGVLTALNEAMIPVDDPAVTLGWSVFDTFLAVNGEAPLLESHLDRLVDSAREAQIPMPERHVLESEVKRLITEMGGQARLRITLTGGGRRIVTATAIDPARRHRPLTAIRGIHTDEPVLGGRIKVGSRAAWVVAVQRSGADEVLMVDSEGRFTEGTSCGILAVIDGELWTAPHDHRILPSVTTSRVVDRALALGIVVHRRGPPSIGPWDALYVASTTRDLAPVVELDGQRLSGWDPVGRRLKSD